jgi:hypothetical protein
VLLSLIRASVLLLVAAPAGSVAWQQPPAVPTWATDVAPIFYKSCVSCHRSGDVAPFQLMTFAEAQKWARQIKDQVVRGEMPPWKTDGPFGEFAEDSRLTQREIRIIADWVDAGAPAGRGQDLPPMPSFPEWQIGKPDVIVGMPKPESIPARRPRFMRDIALDITFDADAYLESAEIIPGRRTNTHHAMLRIANDSSTVLTSYLPGGKVPLLPAGVVKRIPKGSRLTLTMHYRPADEAAIDAGTRVGLKFAKAATRRIALTGLSTSRDVNVPPNVSNYQGRGAAFVFTADSHIVTMTPRMYQRGSNVTYTLFLPDGSSKAILKTNRWEDDFSPSYMPKEPIAAPKGSRLEVVGRFDNTKANERNPDPHQRMKYPEEVMEGYFEYTIDSR